MSFSSEVKNELVSITDIPPCCVHAMAYGMLLFGRSFNSSDISLMTDHENVAQKYVDIVNCATGFKPYLSVSEAKKYTVSFKRSSERIKVLSTFSSSGKEGIVRINRGNLLNESGDKAENINCCNAAFLRGAFLSCGTITDPSKNYRIEFVVPYKTLSLDLMKILTDYGFKAKHMVRRYINVIYIKDSSSIEDLLTTMGAQLASLKIMDIKVYRDVRNTLNRRNNFEEANLTKTVIASYDQVAAINNIKDKCAFNMLSDDLKQMAEIRVENAELSLREIGEMFNPPLTRSAVNHRLKKLMDFSERLNKEEKQSEENNLENQ